MNNIFQVWFQGCSNLTDPRFIENAKNWKLMNPEWNYYCVSDRDLAKACSMYSDECAQVYASLPKMHMKIDLGRYVLVYLFGGLYVDMDAYATRSLNYSKYIRRCMQISKSKHVIGISNLQLNKIEQYVGGIVYNNAIVLCSPKNPVMKRFISHVLYNCKRYSGLRSAEFSVHYSTGPASFNKFFGNPRNLIGTEIVVFPKTVFEPCDVTGLCVPNGDTVSLHQFEWSWINPKIKILGTAYYRHKQMLVTIVLVLLFVWFVK